MRKFIFLLAACCCMLGAMAADSNVKTGKAKTNKAAVVRKTGSRTAAAIPQPQPCRVCCTVSVPDPFGGMVGITACAGWLLTGCEAAGERACEKAMRNALEALLDSN